MNIDNNELILNLILSFTFTIHCLFMPLLFLLKIARNYMQISVSDFSVKEAKYQHSKEQYEKTGYPLSEERLMNMRLDGGLFIGDMNPEHRKEYADRLMHDNKKTLFILLIPIAGCIILAFINIWVLFVYCVLLFIAQIVIFVISQLNNAKYKLSIIDEYPELEHLKGSHFYKFQKQLRK